MGRTACTEPQCVYKGALYLFFLPTRYLEKATENLGPIDRGELFNFLSPHLVPKHRSFQLSCFITSVAVLEHVTLLWVHSSQSVFLFTFLGAYTDMRHLTTGIRSEKCVVRRLCRYANVYLHKPREYSIACYIPRLYGLALLLLGYKPVQHVTVLNIVGNCNTMVSITIYYTGWSKSLCAPDEQSPHNWWFEDGHHIIHSECGLCCTEHGIREHSSACQ